MNALVNRRLKRNGFDPVALEHRFHAVHYKRGVHPDDEHREEHYQDHKDER